MSSKESTKASRTFLMASEMVAPGHPDKVMDTIAEKVLDEALKQDPYSRVAIDGLAKGNKVILAGEVTTTAQINAAQLVADSLVQIGYVPEVTPEFNNLTVETSKIITAQSPDIKMGVDSKEGQEGAGDQGIMFGFATAEAPDLTGHAHYLARLISYKVYNRKFAWAKPDQKTQITVKYTDGVASEITDCVVAISHKEDKSLEEIRKEVKEFVEPILAQYGKENGLETKNTKYHINATGRFVIAGPIADSGEVGRKIVCDQYGGYAPVGGGNLNGKDPTKVDRTAVYMARYVAKNIVAAGFAAKVCIQLGYCIGEAEPVSVNVETYGTETVPLEEIEAYVSKFSFSPTNMSNFLKLRDKNRGFLYQNLGMYGHIGERFDGTKLPWEEIEKVDTAEAPAEEVAESPEGPAEAAPKKKGK